MYAEGARELDAISLRLRLSVGDINRLCSGNRLHGGTRFEEAVTCYSCAQRDVVLALPFGSIL